MCWNKRVSFNTRTMPNTSTGYFLDDMRKSIEMRDDHRDTPLIKAAYAL